MNLCADMVRNQTDDAFAVSDGKLFAGVGEAFAQAVDPEAAIRIEHHLDDIDVFERGADRYERWFGALIRDDNPSRNFADGVHPEQRTYALYSWGV